MPAFMVRFLFVATTALRCARAGKRTLPSVESVLTKANSKVHGFAQQVVAMRQQIEEKVAKSRAALNKQKEEYESLLQAQSNQSQAIEKKIDELQSYNSKLSQLNTEMMIELQRLAGQNREMRDALQDITSKVSTAQFVVTDSLNLTDDSTAKELEVLSPVTPTPTLDSFLATTRSETIPLLVQIKRRDDGPEELVSMLAGSLAGISTAEQDGAADLKARFVQSFREGERHQAELNETLAALEQKQSSLKEYHAKLLDAKALLEAYLATAVDDGLGVSLLVETNSAIAKTDSSPGAVVPAMVPAPARKTQVPVAAKPTQVFVAAKPAQAPVKKMLRT